ncbi:response regulator [Candidatus Dojkabacteria bacterium]|nr:response regulator [Candidatus Dojkabacteria bacterium]
MMRKNNITKFIILLITDNPTIKQSLTEYYIEKPEVLEISSEEENYINRIKQVKPKIIIVDTETKSIDALHICKNIRKKYRIPQIIISKDMDNAHLSPFIKVPVQDFMSMPLSPEVLYMRVRALITNRKRRNANQIERNGKIFLNRSKKKIIINGKVLDFTPKEFRLLRFLFRNKGKVLSRDSILTHVWGINSYVIDRNVDVYIGRVRKKLSKYLEDDYIITKPSFGYMMKEMNKKNRPTEKSDQ